MAKRRCQRGSLCYAAVMAVVVVVLWGPDDGAAQTTGDNAVIEGRVFDADSENTIPSRISIRNQETGEWYFVESAGSDGSAVRYEVERGASVEKHTSLSAHPFTARVPAGVYTITAERGKEFFANSVELEVADANQQVAIPLKRWIDMPEVAQDEQRRFRLEVEVVSPYPIERIETVVNGEVTALPLSEPEQDSTGAHRATVETDLDIPESSWVAVRCFAATSEGRPRFAHTGPFHIDVAGRPLRPRRVEVEYLVQRMQAEIRRSKDVLPPEAVDEYRQALAVYEGLLASAQ